MASLLEEEIWTHVRDTRDAHTHTHTVNMEGVDGHLPGKNKASEEAPPADTLTLEFCLQGP